MRVSITIVRNEPEKAPNLIKTSLLCLTFLLDAAPLSAQVPNLTFTAATELIGRRAEAPARVALPVAAFDGASVPSRVVEGRLSQMAYRLEGARDGTLVLISPLKDQLVQAGFAVIFECDTTGCGGYDFRFGMDVLPEPQMHVDLGDFRYLVAEDGSGGMVNLLVSRSLDQGFVQVTSVTPLPKDAQALAPVAPVVEAPAVGPDMVEPETPLAPAAETDLGAVIAQNGTAALDDLVFASGKAALEDGDYASLAALAAWLQANPVLRVTLVGHTDASGSLAGNVALSKQRAQVVRQWLIDRLGADGAQIDAQGAGYLAPRATNQTPEGRQRNRRVEVMLTSTPVK